MILADKLCYSSKLRYENAGEKVAFAAVTLCICVVSRSAAVACIVLAAMGFLTVVKGGVKLFRYLKLLSLPVAFLLASTLAILFNIGPEPMDLFAVPLGDWYFTAGRESFLYAVRLILTALASVSCLYFLSFTTPVPDILEVLRKLHCPKLLLELMLLVYRFIFLLLDTASVIMTAQNCRLGNRDWKTSLRSFGMMGSALMLLASRRANQLYVSMEARCYEDTIRVLPEGRPPKAGVIAAIAVFDGALLLFALWRKYV